MIGAQVVPLALSAGAVFLAMFLWRAHVDRRQSAHREWERHMESLMAAHAPRPVPSPDTLWRAAAGPLHPDAARAFAALEQSTLRIVQEEARQRAETPIYHQLKREQRTRAVARLLREHMDASESRLDRQHAHMRGSAVDL